jgi:SAM-dependent methyltransferase
MTPFMSINKREWEELATLDPLWSILSDGSKRFSRWDVEEFYASGVKEISEILGEAASLGYPLRKETALDFGCGVGRVTRALADHFRGCLGIDISERMIELARHFNGDKGNCHFIVNTSDRLGIFPSDYFDMIYSNIVLQHVPRRCQIKSYISEFVRVLSRNGLLVFQLPSWIPLRNRIQLRRRLYLLLRRLYARPEFLYAKLNLYPIRMNFVREGEIVRFLESRDGRVLRIRRSGGGRVARSCLYFVSK